MKLKIPLIFQPCTWLLCGFILFFFADTAAGSAPDHEMLERSLTELQVLRESMRNTSLPLLVLLKELDTPTTLSTQQTARIITPVAAIRESFTPASATMIVARMHEEFIAQEKHDDWYRIDLPDGRTGWIHEEMVQVFTTHLESVREDREAQPDKDLEDILMLASGMIESIGARYDSAATIFQIVDDSYASLSGTDKQTVFNVYQEINRERDKIHEYHTYANHYYGKIAGHREFTPAGILSAIPPGYSGTITLHLGSSAYESGGEESLTSRHINISGRKIINDRSHLNLSLAHRNDVIQTPFTTNNVGVGYAYRTMNGLTINSRVHYTGYDDKSFDRNNFNHYTLGFDVTSPVSRRSEFFSQFSYDSKSYQVEGGNEFNSGRFQAGMRMNNPDSRIVVQLRGNIQSSEISFLDFKRFVPQLQYVRRQQQGTFSVNVELEQFSYAAESEANNYTSERLDVAWNRQGGNQRFSIIGKQFPNFSERDYIKLGWQMSRQNTRRFTYSRDGAGLLLVLFPNGGEQQVHYLDTRLDRYRSDSDNVFEAGLFGRVWNTFSDDIVRNHHIDIFARYAWKYSVIEIGPIAGAHLLINENERILKRDGNSIRAGLDCTANFFIQKSSFHISTRYERSFVFGHELSISPTGLTSRGELVTRQPHTFTFTGAARIPIMPAMDLTFDINHYSIGLDVDETTSVSIEPISNRSRMVFRAGLGYRFGQ